MMHGQINIKNTVCRH